MGMIKRSGPISRACPVFAGSGGEAGPRCVIVRSPGEGLALERERAGGW